MRAGMPLPSHTSEPSSQPPQSPPWLRQGVREVTGSIPPDATHVYVLSPHGCAAVQQRLDSAQVPLPSYLHESRATILQSCTQEGERGRVEETGGRAGCIGAQRGVAGEAR
jgi:hypothetical protein